jgi:hypothetical protein
MKLKLKHLSITNKLKIKFTFRKDLAFRRYKNSEQGDRETVNWQLTG